MRRIHSAGNRTAVTRATRSGRDLHRNAKKSSSNSTPNLYHKIKLVSRILFFLARCVWIWLARSECRARLSAGGITQANRALRVRSHGLDHAHRPPAHGTDSRQPAFSLVSSALHGRHGLGANGIYEQPRAPFAARTTGGRTLGFSASSPGN